MTQEWAFPASFAQERVWSAHQLDPTCSAFTLSHAWRFPEGIDATAATEVVDHVLARHEALRTHLRVDDGALVQVVRAHEPVRLPIDDLRNLPEPARAERFAALRDGLAQLPVAPDVPPLWRARLVRLDDAWWLIFVVHQAVFDRHSTVLFTRELAAFSQSALTGAPAEVPELPIQYADYTVWQRGQLTAAELDRQLAFWRKHLEGASPVTALPLDRPRPAELRFTGDEVSFALPDALLDRIGTVATTSAATPYLVLLAGFVALLSRLSGDADVVVGISTPGRDSAELTSLIGTFVNPIPLRCDVGGDPRFTDLVARVRDALVEVMAHGATPFQRIVEAVRPRRDPGVPAIFQTVLNVVADPGPHAASPGTAGYDLTFDITPTTCRLVYRTDLFDRATAEALAARYVRLLTAAAEAPGRRVAQLPWDDGDATRGPVSTAGPGADPARLVEGVQRQAAATPDATALVCDDASLTYAELNGAANRLARLLVARGAGPGSRVALLLPRSAELVVAMLAVLKSGAAYVPTDVALPPARIARLLADAAPALAMAVPETAALAPVDVLVLDGELGADQADTDLAEVDRSGPVGPHPPTDDATGLLGVLAAGGTVRLTAGGEAAEPAPVDEPAHPQAS